LGRRKTYDRDDVTDRAMRLFWRQGYHATSTRDLTAAMGVNTCSLYAEFGSKEGLYEAAIARYEARVFSHHFARLEAADASLETLHAVLDDFAHSPERPGSEVGCLLCNATTELAPTPSVSRETSGRFVHRLQAAFANTLTHAVATGDLRDDTPISALASLYASVLLGVFVLLRAKTEPAVVRDTMAQATQHLSLYAR